MASISWAWSIRIDGGACSGNVDEAGEDRRRQFMRVLVTGGAGFIGSAVCRQIARLPGWQVVNLDKLTYAASLASLAEIANAPNYRLVEGDVCNQELLAGLFADFQPEAVIHLAAETHVDRSIMASGAFIQTNVIGTHALLEAALTYWERLEPAAKQAFRLIHVSTDEVYGSLGETGLFSEDTAYDPRSPYSASKAAADHLASAWHHTYGLPVMISNCSNNYGPFQFPEKLIPNTILNALAGKPIDVYGDGGNVRDWLFVDDHVAALLKILTGGQAGRTYTIGGGSERTNLAVVENICALLDEMAPKENSYRQQIRFVADRPGHDRRYAIDATRISTELGWSPAHRFEDGLRTTVRWYLDREDWWKPIREHQSGERIGLKRVAP
jgi:dTDP-glucose 4,6-dehydratase